VAEFLQALGIGGTALLVLLGLIAGWIAALLAGGKRWLRTLPRHLAIGVAASLATPTLLAAIGVRPLAAGGLLAIVLTSAWGAAVALLLARILSDKGWRRDGPGG